MSLDFSRYHSMIMDASIFTKPFPDALCQYLQQHGALVAPTYHLEIQHFQTIIPDAQHSILNGNLEILKRVNVQTISLPQNSFDKNCLHRDLYGTICLFTGHARYSRPQKHRLLVVTSNLLLIQRLVLENVPIDIYYLEDDELLSYDDFYMTKQYFAPSSLSNDKSYPPVKFKKVMELYLDDGTPFTLTEPLEKMSENTTESHIYNKCENPTFSDMIGKVFKSDSLKVQKIENVRRLQILGEKLELPWVFFPVRLLYRDPEGREPVGYLEKRAENPHSLGGEGYLNHAKIKDHPDIPYAKMLQLCILMVRQVMYLGVYDVCPIDYNPDNFSTSKTSNQFLFMWDTDSFNYQDYDKGCWYLEFPPPKKQFSSNKLNTITIAGDALYQCVFSFLTLLVYPFYGTYPRHFLGDKVSDRSEFYLMIPENLRKLFFNVFVYDYPPSIEILLQELHKSIMEHPYAKMTLQQVHAQARICVAQGETFLPRAPKNNTILTPPALPKYPPIPRLSTPVAKTPSSLH